MSNNPDVQGATATPGLSRRTVMKGVAWAAPVIAVGATVPLAAASPLPRCIGDLKAVGGTYPVSVALMSCNTASAHWDFNFSIAAVGAADCDCKYVRITFYDNPKRSRLWRTYDPSKQLYIQKAFPINTAATFPTTGDVVKTVVGNTTAGTITAPGSDEDSLHTLFLPGGGLPCGATGPMATYDVDCGNTVNGPWTNISKGNPVNPCVPMIKATVCRTSTSNGGAYRLGISVLDACGIAASDFKITSVYRNNSADYPNQGGSNVWTGSQALGSTVTNINTAGGSGGYLWISFTTDNGASTSRIIVQTTNTSC